MRVYSGDRQIVALATTGRERSPALADVPTVAESGLPDYEVTSWNALAAPAGTPPEIVSLLNRAVNDVLALPDVKAAASSSAWMPAAAAWDDLRQRIAL